MALTIKHHVEKAIEHSRASEVCAHYANRYRGGEHGFLVCLVTACEWQEFAAKHHTLFREHADAAIAMIKNERLYADMVKADKAWERVIRMLCPETMALYDFKYERAARGEPGTRLRKLYDARCRATAAWFNHTT